MPRIRTIKPEFPQSESMGRVSRDARLLFIQLWTICDDAGRTRAASRMLASLLFPYDDDAPSLIEGWLEELEKEECIVRYRADGSTYLQIRNWLNHQKIDKPSQSKLPAFEDNSRSLAKPREESSEDLRTKDLGPRTKDTTAAKAANEVPEEFEIAWADYPKREGGNPKGRALKAWNARITSGAKAEEIHAGVKRYAAFIRGKGKEGTEFVMQASTFFGPDEPFRETWEAQQTDRRHPLADPDTGYAGRIL